MVRQGRSVLMAAIAAATMMAGCGGGGGSDVPGSSPPPPTGNADQGCDGSCATAASRLAVADVQQIIAQAVAEANAQSAPATIAVVDRVGNVLGVFKMNGAPDFTTIRGGKGQIGGLEEIAIIPSELSAIAKAVTGAYLSSEGNAFTTRTASQIVQENFNPGEFNQPGGPLFGVQFSQLPCSDFSGRFNGTGVDAGPKRSPLGLSADPGGMPLYFQGVPVGGIGVESDGIYTLDPIISDFDRASDELIAVAGTFGRSAPLNRRANTITVDGKTFRFSDVDANDLASSPDSAASFAAIDGVMGSVIPAPGYFSGTLAAGTAFGQNESGIRPDTQDYPGQDAFVLVDENNVERFRPRAGTTGEGALTEQEVRTLINEALSVANRARAQIRRPFGSQARVSISVVDSNGVILGIARTRDAPIFGTDVSLQKARTASFFSGAFAGGDLRSAADVNYINEDGSAVIQTVSIGDYAQAAKDFLGSPTALDDGAFAFADRSGGNLSRPFFPDGLQGSNNGPFSKPFEQWSPFTDGLQLDLVYNTVINHVVFYLGAIGVFGDTPPITEDVPQNCSGLDRLPNGIQIFPGSVPIYRGNQLVGGIGVSGDGIDQDDMISFLGLHNAGVTLGTINNAAPEIRADNLTPQGIRLRYVQCPQTPFLDSDEQNVCGGK